MKPIPVIGRRWGLAPIYSVLAVALVGFASTALAQDDEPARPTIRDLVIGEPISAQPTRFQEYACGTNGGPPSVPITDFTEFAICAAEESGLHEVQFRYDDEQHFIALAERDPLRAEFFQGTKIGNFPIIASGLFDNNGILRGIRAVTDDRVSDRTRRFAYSMPIFARAVFGGGEWDCVDLPVNEGETPVGNNLVKEDCHTVSEAGFVMSTEARLLRRPGQTLIDPANGLVRAGYYESTGRFEMYAADADGNPIYGGDSVAVAVDDGEAVEPTGAAERFLAGLDSDCPGCDLAGADLKRRDLAGADLSGADLTGATLHRALLGGATLDGANLTDANLNLADLKRASLVEADLTGAYLYQTDAAAADLTGVILDGIVAENARFTGARMAGVMWRDSYAVAANLAGADLTGANLVGTALVDADLQGASLVGADLTDVSFYRARLRRGDLSEVTALHTDFLEADLSDVKFVNADLTDARLLRARASGMDLTGAILTATIMPDGTVAE